MSSGTLLTNTFRIPLLDHLTVPYRLVRFDGVFVDDAEYDKNVQLLATTLGRETGGPVALVHAGDAHVLAVAETRRALPERLNLCGTVARLRPESDVLTLRFCGENADEQDIAKKFLRWALRGSFYHDAKFWEHYGLMTERQPLTLNGYDSPIDVYRAFGYGLVPASNGTLELSVEVSFCYLARHSLQESSELAELSRLKFERCLYKYGLEWYLVEVSGPARRLSEIEIPDPRTGRAKGLLPFIQERWARERIPATEELQTDDWALHYKDGKNQRRWAATPLLYRVYSSQDAEGGGIHHRSILAPYKRRREIEQAVCSTFSGRQVFGQQLTIEPTMRRLPHCTVPLPRLIFGEETEVPLHMNTLKTDKWNALRAPGVGSYTTTAFDKQYVLCPASLPASITADFIDSVRDVLADIYPEAYDPEIVLYHDSGRTLAKQLQAMNDAIGAMNDAIGHKRGYILQILPAHAHPKLYTFLKRKQAELGIHSQCARQEAISSFYREVAPGKWEVLPSRRGDYRSYLKYLGLGILAVNRKWLWRLADQTLHYPGYIGIDVYKGTAAFTFTYLDGSDIYFRTARSSRDERLSQEMVVDLLLDRLPKDFQRLGLRPEALVVHRDGRLCTSERRALQVVEGRLKEMGIVADNFAFIVVEVHKSSAYHPRLFWEQQGKTFNPRMGTMRVVDDHEVLMCTTGDPLLTQGTADPVHLIRVMGTATISSIAADFYALSHLGFTSPGACHRLAITLSLADHILRERRPARAEEQPWGEEEEKEEDFIDLNDHP